MVYGVPVKPSWYNRIPPGAYTSAAIGALAAGRAVFGGKGPGPMSGVGRSTGVNTLVTHRAGRKRGRRSFKDRVLALEPTKHFSNLTAQATTHDTMYVFVPTFPIVEGDTNLDRIGDSIDLMALKIKGYFQAAAAANAYSFRVIVGWSGEELGAGTFGSQSTLPAIIFLPGTYTGWGVNGIINPKAFTVLHDETLDINSEVVATSTISSVAFTVPLNTKFLYQSASSTWGKTRNLFVIVVSDVLGGVAGTTVTGSTTMSYDVIFK